MNKTPAPDPAPPLADYSAELEALLQRIALDPGAGDMRDCAMAVGVAGIALSHAGAFADGRDGFEEVLLRVTSALVSITPLQTLLAVGGPLDE